MQAVRQAVLREGRDDWVPLLAVVGAVRKAKRDDDDPQATALHLVADLVSAGLVTVGDVTSAGFTAAVDPFERLSQLRQSWDDFGLWLRNTTAGDEAGLA